MRQTFCRLALLCATSLIWTPAYAQSAADVLGPAGVVPLTSPQAPARLIVDPPLAGPLAEGMVFIQYRAENLRIEPVFGPAALKVSPRIGHIHVVVDGAPWHWADASGEPLILVGMPAGRHTVEIILANANHQPLDRRTLSFTVPQTLPHAAAEKEPVHQETSR